MPETFDVGASAAPTNGPLKKLGLLFSAAVETLAAAPVVVLDQGFWQRRYGGDPMAVGRTIRLNGKQATVIGVADSEFSGLSLNQSASWAPLTQQPYFAAGSRLLTDFGDSGGVRMWGRLRPGVAPKAAEQELQSLVAELRKRHPGEQDRPRCRQSCRPRLLF